MWRIYILDMWCMSCCQCADRGNGTNLYILLCPCPNASHCTGALSCPFRRSDPRSLQHTIQSNTEQLNTIQSNTEQSNTIQSNTEQLNTIQSNTEQSNTIQSNTEQTNTIHKQNLPISQSNTVSDHNNTHSSIPSITVMPPSPPHPPPPPFPALHQIPSHSDSPTLAFSDPFLPPPPIPSHSLCPDHSLAHPAPSFSEHIAPLLAPFASFCHTPTLVPVTLAPPDAPAS